MRDSPPCPPAAARYNGHVESAREEAAMRQKIRRKLKMVLYVILGFAALC